MSRVSFAPEQKLVAMDASDFAAVERYGDTWTLNKNIVVGREFTAAQEVARFGDHEFLVRGFRVRATGIVEERTNYNRIKIEYLGKYVPEES